MCVFAKRNLSHVRQTFYQPAPNYRQSKNAKPACGSSLNLPSVICRTLCNAFHNFFKHFFQKKEFLITKKSHLKTEGAFTGNGCSYAQLGRNRKDFCESLFFSIVIFYHTNNKPPIARSCCYGQFFYLQCSVIRFFAYSAPFSSALFQYSQAFFLSFKLK